MMRDMMRRNTRPRMFIPIVLALAYLAPSALMPWVWIDLRSVEISSAPSAQQAMVDADRSTYFPFVGRFEIEFRDAKTDLPVCVIASAPFGYKAWKSGPVHKGLWWWADGRGQLQRCVNDGLEDGTFYAVTCHNVLIFGSVSIARRCKRSNDFTLGDDA